ncbi:MAG: pantoate--beta-alanine ligase [Bacteroidia bacterium]|nr:pantoate--beta-alanine ligase [Bacteroidia bacterium]
MYVIKHIKDVKIEIQKFTDQKKSIGFVPTMGALHEGHLSLIKRARQENDMVAASIFVNPAQFNNKEDLKNYPRTPDKDIESLKKTGCDLIFIPDDKEIYPEPDMRVFNFGDIDKLMEGKFRPGHFNGVALAVSKLFDIINPHRAYFGEKDYQQLLIVKALVKQLNIPIEIVPCPTIRESDGLAMSSRNRLITEENRKNVPIIYKTLSRAKELSTKMSVPEIKKTVISIINSTPDFMVEYFEIADCNTFFLINDWAETKNAIGCIAVYVSNVRLIDNIKF